MCSGWSPLSLNQWQKNSKPTQQIFIGGPAALQSSGTQTWQPVTVPKSSLMVEENQHPNRWLVCLFVLATSHPFTLLVIGPGDHISPVLSVELTTLWF
jgi:hypothetical protein